MNKKWIYACCILLALALLALLTIYLCGLDIAVLNPKGMIALKQRELLITATLLMLIIVVPVFILTIVIAWKYRAGNSKAKYSPDWDKDHLYESIWWGFPTAIAIALGIIIWNGSHELDPFKPLDTGVKSMKIQAIALQWKWLFIYPEQNIATLNFVQFPEQVPIEFEITSDAPMNSFWIPQLGGQIYAMSGMRTKIHLIANEIGSFRGSSANISGTGFAGMTFTAKASSQEDFDRWVQSIQESSGPIRLDEYNQLTKPSAYDPVAFYVLKQEDLFDQVVMKYMVPAK